MKYGSNINILKEIKVKWFTFPTHKLWNQPYTTIAP